MLTTITETLRCFIESIYEEDGIFGLIGFAIACIAVLSALVGFDCRTKGHERVASNAIGISTISSLLISTMTLWMWINTETGLWACDSAAFLVWALILIIAETIHCERLRQEEIDKEKYLPKALARLEASNKEIEKCAAEFRGQCEKDESEWHPYGTFKQNYGTFNQHWDHFT